MMILIQRLPARQSAPGYHLMHIGVAGVVADMLALQPGPDRCGDDLARLGDDIAEAYFLLLLALGQVHVIAPGHLSPRLPCLARDFAVRLGGKHQETLAAVTDVFHLRA